MKNLIIGAALTAILCSPSVFAAPLTTGQSVILTDCALLADDVNISLSNGVVAGYACVETPLADRGVTVATCHETGRTASRTERIACSAAATPPDGVPACETEGVAFNLQTATGASIYIGRTAGGSIGPAELDDSLCSSATVEAKLPGA